MVLGPFRGAEGATAMLSTPTIQRSHVRIPVSSFTLDEVGPMATRTSAGGFREKGDSDWAAVNTSVLTSKHLGADAGGFSA